MRNDKRRTPPPAILLQINQEYVSLPAILDIQFAPRVVYVPDARPNVPN